MIRFRSFPFIDKTQIRDSGLQPNIKKLSLSFMYSNQRYEKQI